ncbi:MAG: putative nucleotide-diphospho-sugar transferase [Ilumatobacter sp.]
MKPVFIHISKNAGTSIVSSAHGDIVDAGHRTAAGWIAEHGATAPLFAVVRDPLDRVISEYFYRRHRWEGGEANPHLANLDLSFDDWVSATYGGGDYRTRSFFERTGVGFNEHNMVDDVLIWFIKQVEWLSNDHEQLLVDDVLRFEHLAADWARFGAAHGIDRGLVHANAAARSAGVEQAAQQRTIDLIYEYFRDDYERFGYERQTARSSPSSPTLFARVQHAAKPTVEHKIAGPRPKGAWAPVRFHQRGRLVLPEQVRETAERIYALHSDDDGRFDAAVPTLRRELDLSDRVLIAMTCNHRFASLLENWAASCDRASIEVRSKTLIFATDQRAFDRARQLGFSTYYDGDSELLGELGASATYGDSQWTVYMYHQNWVIRKLLQLEVDVLFQDVDLVWHHDPVPLLVAQARDGAHVQAMCDGPNPRFQPLYANSGFMFFRNTAQVIEFWDEVYARHDMVGYYRGQQEPLNVMLSAHAQRGLDVRVLDERRFANGHLFTPGGTAPPDPWVVHFSWTANIDEKLERYEQADMWFLDR